ncbi:MAG: hypothetical protein JXX14_16250 [Deltaproteobacteria bacterium]|nr:hypothetical protein [Deltaproteobacteria bacterium]
MVQVDLPGAIAVGQIAALMSKSYLQNEAALVSHRLMGPVSTYLSTMFAPVGMFLLICWPAWEGMYWWQWIERPAANPPVAFFYVGFYLSMIVLGIASFILGHRLILAKKIKWVKVGAVVSVVLTLAPFFVWPYTWYWVGTYADYHAVPRTSTVMFTTPSFFWSWLVVIGYFLVTTTLFGLWLKRKVNLLANQRSSV